MEANLEQLRQIAEATLSRLRALPEGEARALLIATDYHGFSVARFPESFHAKVVAAGNLSPEDVQLEVVHVACDLSDEIHSHQRSTALIVCLGSEEHFPAPQLAQGYLVDRWSRISAGDEVRVPAGTPHGFTVGEGGSLYFLSVQSPPIVGKDGHDDYTKLT